MTWRVADSLDVLLEEINAAAPRRSKISDGSIGDAAHASRSSDHNPWVVDRNGVGVVRARDFTHDPGGGLDCNELAHALASLVAAGAHPACRSGAYVIWRGQILSFDRRAEGWRPYDGSNPHDHHLHLSVATAAAGYDSRRPWGVMEEEEIMATKQELGELLDAKLAPIIKRLDRQRDVNRGRFEKIRDQLADLERQAADDATRKQVANLRAEVAATLEDVDQ